MYGRFRREGEGSCRSSQRSIGWHMHPTVIAADSNSFSKDGRNVSIGDCALFKPPQDSPPFIGLIRQLTLNKDNSLQVGVNWLYRPAELKLGKGYLLDSAPNEIFYSFHKDEIPAASLLHPCKVAFLPRGSELPTGTSSFVCRRVYDIENQCLWWLTDQDYINERQEEVDQLLYNTRIEMHGTSQTGGRSPKQVNGLTSASQLKPGSENAQNSGNSFPSQTKGKKRERGDHPTDPVKRERSSRTDDNGSGQHKTENNVKSDIAKITEKGGLVDFEGVEKLLQLMQPDRLEKKMDLIGRSMLAGVIAATERVECLDRFMQLKGLSVFDEWLQEIQKGKVGGGDKSVEDFLLVLLRALDRLPVNLPALQTCNIGRSVNHLRSHKNVDIQRKARSLVDIWKKRVQAEMTSIDAETGSAQGGPVWSSKSRLPEASHTGSRTPSGSDVAVKSTVTQHSASKNTSVKSSHGESNTKSASSSPGQVKPSSPPTSVKESQPATSVSGSGTPDAPLVREDRSSSSNQSHSYNRSISTKEETKSSTAVSAAPNKISSSSSRNRKGGGFPGASVVQKENSSTKIFSATRSSTSDKVSPSGFASEGPVLEADNPKIIVKISNRSRSPTQGVRGVSPEDQSALSSQTSPMVLPDKHYQCANNSREKSETLNCNTSSELNVDSSQVNVRKDVLAGSCDGAGSVAGLTDEDKSMSPQEARQLTEGLVKNQSTCGKLHETSFSSMNALIESCAKYSEAHSSFSPDDDAGMNLLASVAAGEMSRSEMTSPTASAERNTPPKEEVGLSDDTKSVCSPEDQIRGTETQRLCNDRDGGYKKQALPNGSWPEDGLNVPKQASFSSEKYTHPSHTSADMPTGVKNQLCDSADTRNNADPMLKVNKKLTQKTDANVKLGDAGMNKEVLNEKVPSNNARADDSVDCKKDGTNVAGTEDNSVDNPLDTAKGSLMVEVASSNQSCTIDCKRDLNDGLMVETNSMKKLSAIIVKPELKVIGNNEKREQTSPQQIFSEAVGTVRVREKDDKDIKTCVSEVERDNINGTMDRKTEVEGCSVAGSCSTIDGLKGNNMDGVVEKQETGVLVSPLEMGFPTSAAQTMHKNDDVRGSKGAGYKGDEVESASSVANPSSATAGPDADAKVKFDLNEGFTVEDGKYGEPVSLVASTATNIQMSNSLQFPSNPNPTLHPASITVAAAAKGPFVPPEDLLRSKVELGWKGSAATSAFRPAEPRKVVEVPLTSTNFSDDASTSKNDHGRVMLDIDLNIDLNMPDEEVLEELSTRESNLVNDAAVLLNKTSGSITALGSGGLDLDLNRVDESENGQCSTSRNHNEEGSVVHAKLLGGLPSADVQRGFDLNDGPGFEDGSAEHAEHLTVIQQVKVAMPSQLPGPRTNTSGVGSFSSWFPPASNYSTVAVPSIIPDRADQSFPVIPPGAAQRTFGPSGISPFMPDVYRGSVLSSSPAVSFPSSPFQFPVFPYGHSFPLPSASFPVGGTPYADSSSGTRLFTPPINSQLLGMGPVASISPSFQRPFMVGLPDNGSNSGLESNRKLGRQGLDLNAGPGAIEGDAREVNLPHSSSQHSIANSQLQGEEQARLYPVSGNILKRMEPDGGWDTESFRYKQQSSWQ